MLSLLVLAVLGANQMKVSAPPWKFTGLAPDNGEVLQGRFLTLLSDKADLEIVTAADVAQILGMERQRQMLGCETAGNECMTELAGAIGADAVISGSIARTGSSFVVTVRGLNAKSAKTFATATTRLESEEAVLIWLENEAGRFADQLRGSFDTYVSTRNSVTYTYKPFPWVVTAGGALTAALGGIGFGVSRGILGELRQPGPANNEPQLIRDGQAFQDGGVALMIAGGALVGAGVALLFGTREAQPNVGVVPISGGGGSVMIGGAW